ncbi:unnamed protein product [Dicrocoelium dendriticum]|nr:unnamed protein product [Dicrocoelium dendriticum]
MIMYTKTSNLKIKLRPTQQVPRNSAHAVNGGNECKNGFSTTSFDRNDADCGTYTNSKGAKLHSVTSTFYIRDSSLNRSAGGSLSCGQPSPSSTVEESISSALSPTSLKTESRPQHPGYWLHHSEINLPTDHDFSGTQVNGVSLNQKEQRVASAANLELGHRSRCTGSTSTLDPKDSQLYGSSNMLYGGQRTRNDSEEYLGSYSAGPSHRKIQTLHGSGTSQRRFPSDTTLNFASRDGTQVYTSGSKPGPVTIPARSRSAQPSPGPSPMASPNSYYRASESNLNHDYGMDKHSRIIKPQSIDFQFSTNHRSTSVQSSSDQLRQTNGENEGIESQILPSVREIIRQVEAMTQSNAATSTTDISSIGRTGSVGGGSRITKQQQEQRSLDHYGRGGILRQTGSSQRTPSAPQLRSVQYTPMQAKFNSIAASAAQSHCNVAPPVPPHGTTRSNKTIIGSITRRPEPAYNETSQIQRFETGNTSSQASKKTELLSNLPTDYQKLREAFIEQRREIQRLRKQLAEKDLLISQLQSDIRLYEPWR